MEERAPAFVQRWACRSVNRMSRVAACVALLLTNAGGGATASQLRVAGEADQQLSRTEMRALRGGAEQYPYATLALLSFLEYPCPDQRGNLYLASIPARALTTLLAGSADRDGISSLLAMLQWSPYSSGLFRL